MKLPKQYITLILVPHIKAPEGLPPFDKADSYVVTNCARHAREKVEKTRSNTPRQASDSVLAEEVVFNRLPLYQAK